MIRAVGLLVAAALVAVAAPVAPTAGAAGPASVTLEGRGYGHGRGMSQYGAKEAAEGGQTYEQILGFYYPGVDLGLTSGKVRVLISADTGDAVEVEHRRRLRVREVGTGDSWPLAVDGARRWRLSPVDGGTATRVSVLTDGWSAVRTIVGEAEVAAAGRPIGLITPGGVTRYQGALRSAVDADGGRATVNVVRLEAYLRGVVPDEMPALWHPQAVQAQSVAARTYADYHRVHPRAAFYDLCDTTSCQVYGGVDASVPESDAAIAATAGEVLLADGSPAFSEFSSSNGGWTVAGSVPYQVAQPDPWDPVNEWRVTLSDNMIERAFPAIGDFQRLRVRRRDGNGAWNGRVLRIRIVGSRAARTVDGDDFRSTFGLRSTWFRVV